MRAEREAWNAGHARWRPACYASVLMLDPNPAVAVEGVRQFLKRHATCGGVFLDTPATPGGAGYQNLCS